MKPRVYVETTIASYLVGWLNRHDLYVAANQEFTRQWWAERRQAFELFASAVVLKEAAGGRAELASARLEFLRDISILDVDEAAEALQARILRDTPIPSKDSMRFT